MADNDFFERTDQHWKNRGFEFTPEAALRNFAQYGPSKRPAALDQFDLELREIEPTMANARRISEMVDLRQKFDDVHHALLRAGK